MDHKELAIRAMWPGGWTYQDLEVSIAVTTEMHIRYYLQPKAGRVLARSAATYMLVPTKRG